MHLFKNVFENNMKINKKIWIDMDYIKEHKNIQREWLGVKVLEGFLCD